MHQILQLALQSSTSPKERLFKERRFGQPANKFGTIVLALAALEQDRPVPVKPAMWLAEKLGCSERGAQYLIDGQRGVSAKAIAFIVNELTD